MEKPLKLGLVHAVAGCPDAPFVVCAGGDNAENNFKVGRQKNQVDRDGFNNMTKICYSYCSKKNNFKVGRLI